MIVYIDHAIEKRRSAGLWNDPNDVVLAHLEGTVQRVRPKLMTVGTMLFGLVPLLWATGSGADVMKRIAAPMVGGLVTSAFLTLELIPVISTFWRQEQLLWERLEPLAAPRLARLKLSTGAVTLGLVLIAAALVSRVYVTLPAVALPLAGAIGAALIVLGSAAYAATRRAARRLVWPELAPV